MASRYTNNRANTLTNHLGKYKSRLSQTLSKIQMHRLWIRNKCKMRFQKIPKYWPAPRSQTLRMRNRLTRVWFKRAILMWADSTLRDTGKMGSTMRSCQSLTHLDRFIRDRRVRLKDTCTQPIPTLKRQRYPSTSSSLSTSRTSPQSKRQKWGQPTRTGTSQQNPKVAIKSQMKKWKTPTHSR